MKNMMIQDKKGTPSSMCLRVCVVGCRRRRRRQREKKTPKHSRIINK
jgi:hypothetical protein